MMESDASAGVFRRQALAGDEHIQIIKEQYGKVEEIYAGKVEALRASIEQT